MKIKIKIRIKKKNDFFEKDKMVHLVNVEADPRLRCLIILMMSDPDCCMRIFLASLVWLYMDYFKNNFRNNYLIFKPYYYYF